MPLRDWRRIVDFLVLAATLYLALRWASRARALRIAMAIAALYAGVLVARQFDLVITAWILQGAALISIALLVIVFQPEVRRALTLLDRRALGGRWLPLPDNVLATSAFLLAGRRTGALFAITGREPIAELLEGGVALNADISQPLIEAIFEKPSPLHDGAVIVEAGRIARAGAVLPLTQRPDVPPEFGTRHRAAMGLAERSDALCIAVSEERGDVSVMLGRTHSRIQDAAQLARLVERTFAAPPTGFRSRIRALISDHWQIKVAAAGLSTLIWAAALFDPSSTVRVVEVPVEFKNVPGGLDIAGQSSLELSVQLRGRTWMIDSNQIANLVARFDLSGAGEGFRTLRVSPRSLGLPPGVSVVNVIPEMVEVHLVRHSGPPGR